MGLFAGYHIGFGMLLVATLFAIIAVSNVAWAYQEVEVVVAVGSFVTTTSRIFYGLFRVCVEQGGNENCQDFSDPHDKLQATRGLATSGMICIMIAVCLVGIHMFLVYKDRTTMPSTWTLKLAVGFACFAALINTIANIIYGDFYDSEYPGARIDYAYVFLIIASILASVGSVVTYLGRPKRIEPVTIVTTSNGGTTVAVITTGSYHNSAITNPAYPPQPPSYGYPNPPAYPGPGNSDPAYPPPAASSYQPPK